MKIQTVGFSDLRRLGSFPPPLSTTVRHCSSPRSHQRLSNFAGDFFRAEEDDPTVRFADPCRLGPSPPPNFFLRSSPSVITACRRPWPPSTGRPPLAGRPPPSSNKTRSPTSLPCSTVRKSFRARFLEQSRVQFLSPFALPTSR